MKNFAFLPIIQYHFSLNIYTVEILIEGMMFCPPPRKMEQIPHSQSFQLKSLMCITFHHEVTLSLISQLPEGSRPQNLGHLKDLLSRIFCHLILAASPAGFRDLQFRLQYIESMLNFSFCLHSFFDISAS
jgi:hypothetical protein